MLVRDYANLNVVCCEPDAPIAEVAALMRRHHVGDVVVVDNQLDGARIPIGIVTDRDILVETLALDPVGQVAGQGFAAGCGQQVVAALGQLFEGHAQELGEGPGRGRRRHAAVGAHEHPGWQALIQRRDLASARQGSDHPPGLVLDGLVVGG